MSYELVFLARQQKHEVLRRQYPRRKQGGAEGALTPAVPGAGVLDVSGVWELALRQLAPYQPEGH